MSRHGPEQQLLVLAASLRFSQAAAGGTGVYVNSDNKIGTLVSSRRFKDQIKPMDTASEVILALKPVSFQL